MTTKPVTFEQREGRVQMVLPVAAQELVRRFDGAGVQALVLAGSYARGQATTTSDIDLIRLLSGPLVDLPGSGSHLINGTLIVVSNVDPAGVEECFSLPEIATSTIDGLRNAQALVDRDGYFAKLQARAQAFAWDTAMQERANQWASHQLVGWVEEVHKGLAGLQLNHVGRLLNARFGLSWGLSRVMQVQRGVLLSGDNGFYDEVAQAVGPASEWCRLRRVAFGIEDNDGIAPCLSDQVRAGLQLYVVTAGLLAEALTPDDRPLIVHTVDLINAALPRG